MSELGEFYTDDDHVINENVAARQDHLQHEFERDRALTAKALPRAVAAFLIEYTREDAYRLLDEIRDELEVLAFGRAVDRFCEGRADD